MKQRKSFEENNKKNNLILKFIICFILMVALMIFCYDQNNHLVLTEYVCESEQISNDFDGYRIVQISDFHNAEFGKDNVKLVEMIKGCSPDIIVITGDIVDSTFTHIDHALELVESITPIAPVYYVTGNHEYFLEDEEYDRLFDGMSAAGVKILVDECVNISKSDADIRIIGLDDNSLGMSVLETLVGDEDDFNIVLAHEPQYFSKYSRAGADLVFTGHAHGGQIRLPFIGGLVAPGQGILPEYTEGIHVMDGTQMVISRGLGNSIIPLRVFNYPELICVELKSK